MRRRLPVLLIVLALAGVTLLLGDAFELFGSDGSSDSDAVDSYGAGLDGDGTGTDGAGANGPALRGNPTAFRGGEDASGGGTDGDVGATSGSASAAKVPFKGRVLGPDGRPAGGVRMVMISGTERLVLTTDEDGRFGQPLSPGRYDIQLRLGGVGARLIRRFLVDGSKTEDVELSLLEPARLRLVVRRGAEGVENVEVALAARPFDGLEGTTFEGVTDVAGVAEFEDLPRANYDISAQVPDGPAFVQRAGVWSDRDLEVQVPGGVVLRGEVTAGAEGPGVAGARIALNVRPAKSATVFVTEFVTDRDGRYEVVVPRGRAERFDVQADGFAPWPNPQDWRQRRNALRALRALAGEKPVERNVALEPGTGVRGLVTDEGGEPLSGVVLRIQARRGSTTTVTTAEDGRYAVGDLNPGGYSMLVETANWYPAKPLTFRIQAGQGKPLDYDFALIAARSFRGVVLAKGSKPALGARVWLVGGGGVLRSARQAGRLLETFTDEGGGWVLTDIPASVGVVVRASYGDLEAKPVWIGPTTKTTNAIRLQLGPTGTLAGSVFDLMTREPIRDASVRIQPVEGPGGRTPRTVKTNREGEFKAPRLIPGRWSLAVRADRYLAGEAQVVDLREGAGEQTVSLPLDPGLVFAGYVQDEQGRPIPNAQVRATGNATGNNRRVTRDTRTGPNGWFRVTGFVAGSYSVIVRANGYRNQTIGNLRGGENRLVVSMQARPPPKR